MVKPEITELTVTVKAVKVNSKKMTLAMFRQLPKAAAPALCNNHQLFIGV